MTGLFEITYQLGSLVGFWINYGSRSSTKSYYYNLPTGYDGAGKADKRSFHLFHSQQHHGPQLSSVLARPHGRADPARSPDPRGRLCAAREPPLAAAQGQGRAGVQGIGGTAETAHPSSMYVLSVAF